MSMLPDLSAPRALCALRSPRQARILATISLLLVVLAVTPAMAAVRLVGLEPAAAAAPAAALPDGATPVAAPAQDPAQAPLVVSLDASVESYLAFDANRPRDGAISGHIFDPRHGELAISGVMVGLAADTGTSYGTIQLWRGQTPTVIYSGEPQGPIDWTLLRQAWAGVRLSGQTKLEAGLFLSPIGLESTLARDNWLWSGALLNVAMPFFLSGVRVAHALNETTTIEAGLYGGWTRLRASNIPGTAVVRIFGAPTWGIWQLLLSSAPTRPGLGMDGLGHVRGWLVDGYVSAPLNDDVELAAQLNGGAELWKDGATQRAGTWAAGEVWARYRLGERWKLAGRAGVFVQSGDRQQVQGEDLGRFWWPTSRVAEAALALQWAPTTTWMLRAESRIDAAAEPIYSRADGTMTTTRPTFVLGMAWTL